MAPEDRPFRALGENPCASFVPAYASQSYLATIMRSAFHSQYAPLASSILRAVFLPITLLANSAYRNPEVPTPSLIRQ